MHARICHLITTFYSRSGSSRRTLTIIQGLKKKGYESDLMVGEDSSVSLIDDVEKQGIRVKRVQGLKKQLSPFDDFRAFCTIRKHFADHRYDLVHTHLAKAGILGRYAAKLTKIPVILHTVHGPSFPDSKPSLERRLFCQLERQAARVSSGIVYVGEEIQTRYLAAGVGSADRSHLIYTGRDFSPFLRASLSGVQSKRLLRSKLGLKGTDLVIGYVARIVPSKGHLLAIQIGERLLKKFPRAFFLFVGQANLPSEKPYREFLLAEVAKRGMRGRVAFVDYRPDVENYYAIFDVFILPSLYEGLPNVLLEAVVMHLPIVAFDCGGVREILADQKSVVPTGDLQGFEDKLAEVLETLAVGNVRMDSGNTAASLVARWSIESMIQSKDNLYRRLLERSSGA